MSLKKKITSILLTGAIVAGMVTPAFAAGGTAGTGTFNIEGVVGTKATLDVTLPTTAAFALGTITGGVTSTGLEVVNLTSGVAVKLIADFDVTVAADVVVKAGTATTTATLVQTGEDKNILLGLTAKTGTSAAAAKSANNAAPTTLTANDTISDTKLRLETSIVLDATNAGSAVSFADIALKGYINNATMDWEATDVTIQGSYTLVGEDIDPATLPTLGSEITVATAKSVAIPAPAGTVTDPFFAQTGKELAVTGVFETGIAGEAFIKLLGTASTTTIAQVALPGSAYIFPSEQYSWSASTGVLTLKTTFGTNGAKSISVTTNDGKIYLLKVDVTDPQDE